MLLIIVNIYRRAARIVHKGFDDYACGKQDFLGDEAKVTKLLSLMPAECREDLNEKMKKGKNSLEKWQIFQQCTKQLQVRFLLSNLFLSLNSISYFPIEQKI